MTRAALRRAARAHLKGCAASAAALVRAAREDLPGLCAILGVTDPAEIENARDHLAHDDDGHLATMVARAVLRR